jgi:hypothetical protein
MPECLSKSQQVNISPGGTLYLLFGLVKLRNLYGKDLTNKTPYVRLLSMGVDDRKRRYAGLRWLLAR